MRQLSWLGCKHHERMQSFGGTAAYQRAIREQKMAAEISAAKKERDFYLSRVDRAKAQDARLARQTKV